VPDLPASAKIEEACKVLLEAEIGAGGSLDGFTVLTDQNIDEAIEVEKALIVYTVGLAPTQADEQGQTYWEQTLEIEVVDGPQMPGMISRANQITMANAHALLAADRTFGGRLQDLQETSIAGTQAEGKDVHHASVQYRAEYYTPRDDWFTILGQAGGTF
jgi:hypothetical protein